VLALQLVEDLAEEAAVHVLDVEADHGDLLHAELPGHCEALLAVGDEEVPVGYYGDDEAPPLDCFSECM